MFRINFILKHSSHLLCQELENLRHFQDYQELEKQRSAKANYSKDKAVTFSLILVLYLLSKIFVRRKILKLAFAEFCFSNS